MITNRKSFYDKSTIFAALAAGVAGVVSLVKGDGTEGVLWFLLMVAWFAADDIQGIRRTLTTKHYTVNVSNNGGSIRPEDVVKAMRDAERRKA